MGLKEYVAAFCADDHEYHQNDIDNAHAYAWLKEEIPLLECPNPKIEKAYYFRWWVYRKHIKTTPEGVVISEFLPDVPWSGKYNVISAAAGHHLMEGRWLKHADRYINDYIRFFLRHPKDAIRYSTWLIWAAARYHDVTGALDIPTFLKDAVTLYQIRDNEHKTDCGLYWSIDDRDAMEYSISGTVNGQAFKGVRPTLNSYMYADAMAIDQLSRLCGKPMEGYREHAEEIRSKMQKYLWRDGFYKALHPKDGDFTHLDTMQTTDIPRELIGLIPWYFKIPQSGCEDVFRLLTDPKVFATPYGITTADRSDPRFMYSADHECLWNGYIWPFATSQVLTALLSVVDESQPPNEYADIFYRLLDQYADQHETINEEGKSVMWIDEVMDPYNKTWSSRALLKAWGWPRDKGGFERGKDYNHSTFCDLVLTGLAGVRICDEKVSFHPIIPQSWSYFCVDQLIIKGDTYRIAYDQTGEKYGHQGWKGWINQKEAPDLCIHPIECKDA